MPIDIADLHAEPAAYNQRILCDTATLSFSPDGEGRWIVADILPAEGTREARILGAVIDSASGKMIDPRTGREAPFELGYREKGAWVLIASLDGRPCPARGVYEWEEPFGSSSRPTRIDLYDIFSEGSRNAVPGPGGGVIVTRYDAQDEGRKPFHEVHLIPAAWQETVATAFDACRRGEAPFAAATSTADATLHLRSAIPLTAVAAFRRIASDPEVDSQVLVEAILGATGYLRGVLTYLALTMSGQSEAAAFSLLERVIRRTVTVEGYRSLVAAIGTAGFLAEERSATKELAARLRDVVRARLETIRAGGALDSYLQGALYPRPVHPK